MNDPNGRILHVPRDPEHKCDPPPVGDEHNQLSLGVIWGCSQCGKRYKVVYRDSGFGGDLCWTRRWLPWPSINR